MNTNDKIKDNKFQSVVNFGAVILIIVISIFIYKYFIVTDYQRLRVEGFDNTIPNRIPNTIPNRIRNIIPNTTNASQAPQASQASQASIYEQSILKLYGDNKRLVCSMIPNIGSKQNVCYVNNAPVVIYKFPVHIIKLIDGSILAVFNDGRLYQKQSMASTIWSGPITNSMPQNTIPLRMICLSTDLITLLGVGYDNNLYMKAPDTKNNINLPGLWVKVPNNSSIIYVLFDRDTNFMLSIDTNGKLFTKPSSDKSETNKELVSKIDRPILRLYYDLNGYMLVIDDNFDLYQFNDIDWKTSIINTDRGANSSKINDLLYDNDGKMYGLVFNQDAFMVQIMKQNEVFYLANFEKLNLLADTNTNANTNINFVMSDKDIINSKIGSIYDYILNINNDDSNDDDPNFAYHKQIIENQSRLKSFCKNRGLTTASTNYDNYDLLSNVDQNNDKIDKLKNIINNLISYEPDSNRIKEKYPIINNKNTN